MTLQSFVPSASCTSIPTAHKSSSRPHYSPSLSPSNLPTLIPSHDHIPTAEPSPEPSSELTYPPTVIPTKKSKVIANSTSGLLTTSGLVGVAVCVIVAAILIACACYFLIYRYRSVKGELPTGYLDSHVDYDDGTIFGMKPTDLRSSAFGQTSPYSITSSDGTADLSHVYGVSASVRQSLHAFQSRWSRSTESFININVDGESRDAPSMSAVTTRDLDSVLTTVNPSARFRN